VPQRRLVSDQRIEPSAVRTGFRRIAIDMADADLRDATATLTVTVEWAEDQAGKGDEALAWRHLSSMEWRGGAVREGTTGFPGIGTVPPPGARTRVRVAVAKPTALAVTED
jgi:hypothetical protein